MLALVRNIAERKRAERALHDSEERLATIVGSAMDAIVSIDEDRTIRLFNSAAEKVFRCAADEALDRSFDTFATEAFRELLTKSMLACGAATKNVASRGRRRDFVRFVPTARNSP